MKVSQSVRHIGRWWRPERPDEKLFGTLHFTTQEGATLKLRGVFADIPGGRKRYRLSEREEIILGEAKDGNLITLHDSIMSHSQFSYPGNRRTSEYLVRTFFVGAHFASPAHIKFSELFIRFMYLQLWVAGIGESLQARIPLDNLLLEVLPASQSPRPPWLPTMHFVFAEPTPFDRADHYVTLLTKLLSLPAREACYPFEILGRLSQGNPTFVQKYFSVPDMPNEEQKREYAMLFYVQDIATRFEHHIQSWIESAKKLSGVYDLYFGTLRKKRLYEEMRFLSYTQALEIFHRVRIRDLERPKNEWRAIRNRVLKCLPDEKLSNHPEEADTYRTWVDRKLTNSPSLRVRFTELEEHFRELVPTPLDDATITIILKTRNVLTHELSADTRSSARGTDLLLLGNRLQWRVELCLLEALDYEKEKIKRLLPA